MSPRRLNQPTTSDQAQVKLAARGQPVRHVSIQAEERVGQAFQEGRTESRRLLEPPVDHIVISRLSCVQVEQRFLGPAGSPPTGRRRAGRRPSRDRQRRGRPEDRIRPAGPRGVGVRIRRADVPRRQLAPGRCRTTPRCGLRIQPLLSPFPELFRMSSSDSIVRPAASGRPSPA